MALEGRLSLRRLVLPQAASAAAPSSLLQLSGRVVWTGSSSMDIAMELEQAGQQQLTALFTFVARDPVTGKPAAVPALQPQTAEVGGRGAGGAVLLVEGWPCPPRCQLISRPAILLPCLIFRLPARLALPLLAAPCSCRTGRCLHPGWLSTRRARRSASSRRGLPSCTPVGRAGGRLLAYGGFGDGRFTCSVVYRRLLAVHDTARSSPVLVACLLGSAVSLEGERWAQELLVAAKTKRDLPALAGRCTGWRRRRRLCTEPHPGRLPASGELHSPLSSAAQIPGRC